MKFEKCRNIIIIDDDQRILDLISAYTSDYKTYKVQDFDTTKSLFLKNEIALVISDYYLENQNGVEILQWVKDTHQMTRRVLITGHLEINMAVDAVNQADIHSVLQKPFTSEEIKNVVHTQVGIFNERKFQQYEYQIMRSKLDNLPTTISRQTDELLELLLDITETKQIPNFSNHFVKALEGLKSLAILNSQVYFDTQDQTPFNHLLQYLSDIEVIANQYDQKILYLYLLTLRSYLYLYNQDYERAIESHSASLSLLHWLKNQNLDPLLLESIEDYPSHSDKEIITQHEIRPMIELQISKLLSIDTGDLVGMSESLFQYYRFTKPSISYFIIVRNEFPIYERIAAKANIESGLISGFVVALSKFLEEVAEGTGDINTINHENGVILFHSQENINFVLFTSVDDASHRIGLRQIAFETISLLKSIPKGYTTSKDEKKEIDRIVENILGNF